MGMAWRGVGSRFDVRLRHPSLGFKFLACRGRCACTGLPRPFCCFLFALFLFGPLALGIWQGARVTGTGWDETGWDGM